MSDTDSTHDCVPEPDVLPGRLHSQYISDEARAAYGRRGNWRLLAKPAVRGPDPSMVSYTPAGITDGTSSCTKLTMIYISRPDRLTAVSSDRPTSNIAARALGSDPLTAPQQGGQSQSSAGLPELGDHRREADQGSSVRRYLCLRAEHLTEWN